LAVAVAILLWVPLHPPEPILKPVVLGEVVAEELLPQQLF
jgi:hypothetical protein